MCESDVEFLKAQLSIARNEIKNLRQQLTGLQHVYSKDLQHVTQALQDFRCAGCLAQERSNGPALVDTDSPEPGAISFTPVGVIRTVFNDKRAVPRQANVASKLLSRVEISPAAFNNPAHSLEGLEAFSHVWLVYHFHRNVAHTRAKVAPPRLSGERVGVFSTRSPHRPCPIGLSLVQLDRIEDARIYFYGTDMVDGTPVLDIKPYIPQYDVPGQPPVENDFYTSREAPDGEETAKHDGAPAMPGTSTGTTPVVTVPNWITNGADLRVVFNDNSNQQVIELGIEKSLISDVLKADPRSVYLRTRYGSQIYNFQLAEHTVTCKFDDQNSTVIVLQVRKALNLQDELELETANVVDAAV